VNLRTFRIEKQVGGGKKVKEAFYFYGRTNGVHSPHG